MNEQQELVPAESINALELFTQDGVEPLLENIKQQATDFVPDLKTTKGRSEIASMSHKVSKAKVVIDAAGKKLVSEWKQRAKVVDESRRKARLFLDDLRDEVREPLTQWEQEQKRMAEAKRKAEEMEHAHVEAIAEDVLFEREVELKSKEAEMERQAEIRRQMEVDKQIAKEKAERAERIRIEATEKAEREAEGKLKAEREKTERAEREVKEAGERAKRDAEQAEKDRVATAEKAERDKQEAIKRERQDAIDKAAAIERARQQQAEEQKREDERRAADREHRKTVNNRILTALTSEGISKDDAKKVITLVASGAVADMHIRY